ncbi:hypothetical protein M409DRAFT_27563 [Zasmidium cellare ATCC 36951]|uniref:N-acetyltransferase domain-containing protein n=1 Tax=Zasmidium cellare ATCC 36951 TaxID=1080233 RepID=A0A6A6C5A2_ZASCE|nr:uncharacterized protein M409DRAFT_27563 [Zasmidium cellare ATCC 36951]KAF2162185.1 hypothetical protein M409DRAFT_27563 [Zasmidium cellare ATCC 36951]
MADHALPPHKKPPRANRWPTKADFPKPDPNRWKGSWDAHDSAHWDSDKKDEWDSDKNDDGWGDQGAKLTDWDGGWAPPPVDWEFRSAFRPGQSEEQVQRWLDNSEKALTGTLLKREASTSTTEFDGATYAFVKPQDSQEIKQMGDMIPRYWIPSTFGRQDPQTFWEELVRSNAPEPLDDKDLQGVRPWWELLSQGQEFLPEVSHPDIAGIDPDESFEERLAREHDQGGHKHVENRRNYLLATKQADREKKERQKQRTKKLLTKQCNSDRARDNKKLRPRQEKLFIRSARPEDFIAIKNILNYHICDNWATSESEEQTTDDIAQRYGELVYSKMPFLVACEKGAVLKGRRHKNRAPDDDIVLPDTVLGFAYADDYNDMKGMYRYTAQIEVYTDNRHYLKGIASCLMDKMLAMLDPDYLERGGYEVRGDELEGKEPKRLIKNILIHCPFEKPERLEWMTRWMSSMNFAKVGHLDGIGTKLGRAVGLAIFQRGTGAQLNHANPTPV